MKIFSAVASSLLAIATFCAVCQCAAAGDADISRLNLQEGWLLQSSAKIPEPGEVVSSPGFKPQGWIPTQVPSTVLAALVKRGIYSDPYFGKNLAAIPGAGYLASWLNQHPKAQTKNKKNNQDVMVGENFSNLPMPAGSPFKPAWWYRREFELPTQWQGKHLWLHFDGINYRADIWLNGRRLASSDQVVGAWRLFCIDITNAVHAGGANVLAVAVSPPLADDLGITWVDWNPAPPDKDMGLWRPVYICTSGPVALRDPQVVPHFDLPSLETAHLIVRATLQNSAPKAVDGTLQGRIGTLQFRQPVHLAAGESREVTFTPEYFPQLNIHNPRLWWPADLGPQNLYQLHLEFEIVRQTSDQAEVHFGMREITSWKNPHGDIQFAVNGRKILIRGGGWAPDMMLREDPERMETQIRYVRDMHLNALRLEGKIETDQFFDLCDRYGILVMAGWCCCDQWEMWSNWKPENYVVAGASLRDQLLRLQNHPCVLDWMYGSDKGPPPRAEKIYLAALRDTHWPNPYESTSDATPSTLTGLTGFKGVVNGHYGPYDYIPPSYWLLDHAHGGGWGFNTETSPGVDVPVLESLRQFLPAGKLWPINDVWLLHADGETCRINMLGAYRKGLDARYGPPADFQDFLRKDQAMDYESERAMFEAYGRNKYLATGLIQWMLNTAWPTVVWNLYDYYLRTGAGYYGTKKACETLHVQYSYDDGSIVVVNSLYQNFEGLRVRAEVYDLNLRPRFSRSAVVNVAADSSTRVSVIPKIEGLTTTYFVKLILRDARDQPVSSNFYWLSTKPDEFAWQESAHHTTPVLAYSDVSGLNQLSAATLKVSTEMSRDGDQNIVNVTLTNPGSALAFGVHLRVLNGAGGSEVIPTFWSDNFLALMPGETQQVRATYSRRDPSSISPVVSVDGWNVTPFEQPVARASH